MPWRPCRRPETRLALLAAVLVLPTLGGCTGGVDAPVAPVSPDPEAAFLADPLLGYPRGVSVDERLRLSRAHEALVGRRQGSATSSSVSTATSEAVDLLERNPDLHPARLVLAQAELVTGDSRAALERVRRLVQEVEGYFAARLLLARAAEKVGDLVAAYDGYFDLSERSAAARQRGEEIRKRVLEIVANRSADALRRRRHDEAGAAVKLLAKWAAGEPVTLFAARDLAAAVGDREAELRALRQLEPQFPGNRDLRGERAELELEVGEASVGLRIYQDLATAAPDDPVLAGKLARAKFLWRLTLLPAEVQTLVRQPRLSRGEFAAVLYWLFPQVRYGQSRSGTIATDVLDHQYRDEIVRAVNLGLLSVDPTLHTYRPEETQTRASALVALLELLGRQEPRLACLGPPGPLDESDAAGVCRSASRCGLVGEQAECLPLAALSGPDAFEMSRGALGQLGIE